MPAERMSYSPAPGFNPLHFSILVYNSSPFQMTLLWGGVFIELNGLDGEYFIELDPSFLRRMTVDQL